MGNVLWNSQWEAWSSKYFRERCHIFRKSGMVGKCREMWEVSHILSALALTLTLCCVSLPLTLNTRAVLYISLTHICEMPHLHLPASPHENIFYYFQPRAQAEDAAFPYTSSVSPISWICDTADFRSNSGARRSVAYLEILIGTLFVQNNCICA